MNKSKKLALDISKKVKSKKDFVVMPIVRLFDYLKFTPSMVSILVLVFGIIAAVFLRYSKNLFLLFIFIAFLLDLIDGALARYQKKVSKKGGWLDYTSDRLVMIFVMCAVFFILLDKLSLVVILLYLVANASYLIVKKEYQILYYEPVYYLLVYFSFNWANSFALLLNLINILIVWIGIVYSIAKR